MNVASSSLSFLPELAPHVLCPNVAARGSTVAHELLERALIRYLHGTSVLELCVVNPVASSLAHGEHAFAVSDVERRQAIAIVCDESQHAAAADRLLAVHGAPPNCKAPAFLARLVDIRREHASEHFVNFLFTVVTETCVSAHLRRLATDPRVDGNVALFVASHARDEARHAAYFGGLFAHFWSTATNAQKNATMHFLPRLACAFVTPDESAIVDDLRHIGLAPGEASEAFNLSYQTPLAQRGYRRTVMPLLIQLHRAGAFDVHMREAFSNAELYEG